MPDRRSLLAVPPTPLVPLALDDGPTVWCKLEYLNPSGSTKDRVARHVLGKAWRLGVLRPGGAVAEASSGSTAIALAMACAQLGVRFLAVMPEGVSGERVLAVRAYGGEVKFTPAEGGVSAALAEAERLSEEGYFLPRQFTNPDSAEAHRVGTAREVVEQIPGGTVGAVASGVGTGGTLVGLAAGLREAGCPAVPVLARPVNVRRSPEPECCSFSGRIPGVVDRLSALFRPETMPDLLTVEVDDEHALNTARRLIQRGFPVGPSSGLNFNAAVIAAERLGPDTGPVVTVFPDRMERYFTTELFAPFR